MLVMGAPSRLNCGEFASASPETHNAFIREIDALHASMTAAGKRMKIDTLGVQAFIAVAIRRNFRRAAAELHITQTALSRRLQTLEAYLGVKLIQRTTRSVELTRTGAD